ncbi:MAG: hypothetical protein WB607_20755 [Candidatus Acidiferrum sp.]|jgi:hypothetical protein
MQVLKWVFLALASATLSLLISNSAFAQASLRQQFLRCDQPSGILCAEQLDNPGGWKYVGHDEPSLLFYSNEPGSGYRNVYKLRLPKDPPIKPKSDGSGGTWNFQLHPAFWFGMAMCDDQSAPNPGGSPSAGPNIKCAPDSDTNIYNSPDPTKPGYIGRHPGAGFTEMQFYPPGWINGNSLTQWTAALNIDSLSENYNTGQGNNAACGGAIEYVNFAYIQKDGVPFPPGSPSPLGPFVQLNSNTLFMNSGDELIVTMTDTEHGLKVIVKDVTSGESGFIVASAANGFAQILFDPNGNNCDFATHNLPYDFHPMYATSSEHTRVPWAAHSYNIAFSDEIGHFENCSTVASEFGACTSDAANDPPGIDDNVCVDAAYAASYVVLGLPAALPIGGCVDADEDFDGIPYQGNRWPGSFWNPFVDALFHPQPVIFSSPLFLDRWGNTENFNRVAFETDLPRIEFDTTPACQRHLSNPSDPNPGQGCVNPPVGASFYPFYTTRLDLDGCRWQIGGPYIPFTLEEFGGSSAAEYGDLLALFYPAPNDQPQYIYEDFHRGLPFNPCPTFAFGH